METYYQEVASLLRSRFRCRSMTVFRSHDERDFVQRWIDEGTASPGRKGHGVLSAPAHAGDSDLRAIIDSCTLCGTVEDRKYGYGKGNNGVMIVLNAPRLINKMEMDLYRRDSVEMIRRMVEAIRLSFAGCYTTNLVKCRSLDVIMTPGQMMQNCLLVLEKEIALVKPKIIIVMGEIQPMQKLVHASTGVFWYTVEHPITLLKNAELKKAAWATLKTVMAKIGELGL